MGEDCDVSDSRVRVSGNGDDETLIGELGFEGKVLEGEEGGEIASNGEDIMVEVLGSEVFFDGVCSSGGNSNEDEEAGLSGELEHDIQGGGGGGGVGGDVDMGEVGVLGSGVMWSTQIESEVEEALVVDGSVVQETGVLVEEKSVETVDGIVEVSTVQSEVVEEKSSKVVNNEGSKDGVPATDASVKDSIVSANHKHLDEEIQVGGPLPVKEDQVVCGATQAAEGCEDTAAEKVGVLFHADSESPIEEVQSFVVASFTDYKSVNEQNQVTNMRESAEIKEEVPTSRVDGGTANVGIEEMQNEVEMAKDDNLDYMDEDPEPSGRETRGPESLNPEGGGQYTDTKQPKQVEEVLNSGSSGSVHEASYQLPTENESEFSVSDLVWGKVKHHPWWPGQIFEPSDSSEQGMKYLKKDSYLVAYFGDHTFAWNEPSQLKHFKTHFSVIAKQSKSEAFHNAVTCALEEVSRRVELGLACSCIPEVTYEKIKYQIVENAGIREEASRRDGVDKSASADSFEPDKFLSYLKALGQSAAGGADQLELVIAKAQLLAFYRLKGYSHLPEFQFFEGLVDNDPDVSLMEGLHSSELTGHGPPIYEDVEQPSSIKEKMKSQGRSGRKRKHNLRDSPFPSKKERSLSELMVETIDSTNDENGVDGKTYSKLGSPSSNKNLKAFDSFDEESVAQDSKKSSFSAHVSNTTSSSPRQSFKIGDCIRRVASQLTGSLSIIKSVQGSNQKSVGDCNDVPIQSEDPQRLNVTNPAEDLSANEILSQLHLVAQDPKKGYSFFSSSINFFCDFRDNCVDKSGGGRKRKAFRSISGSPETFEFEDMKDSYWTDRVIQNGSEEKISRKDRKVSYQPVVLEPQDTVPKTSRVYSRRKFSNSNHKAAGERQSSSPDRPKQDLSPTELIMSFPDVDSIPSETKLNNMFRRFGPLKEFETEVNRETFRARVVFKRCSDAEVACSSAGKFNIFGSTVVHYELSYTPSVSYRATPIAPTQNMEVVTMQELDFASQHDLEFVTMQELEDATMQDMHYTPTQDLEGATMQDLEFPTAHDLDFATMHHLGVATSQAMEISSTQVPEDVTIQDMEMAAEYQKAGTGQDQEIAQDSRDDIIEHPEIVAVQGPEVAPYDTKVTTTPDLTVANEDLGIGTRQDPEIDSESLGVDHEQDTEVANEDRIQTRQGSNMAAENLSTQDTEVADKDLEMDATKITKVVDEDLGVGSMQAPEVATTQDPEGATQDVKVAITRDPDVSSHDTKVATTRDPGVANQDMRISSAQYPEVADEDSGDESAQNPAVGKLQEFEVATEDMKVDALHDTDVARTQEPEVGKIQEPDDASEVKEVTRPEDPEVALGDHAILTAQDAGVATTQATEAVKIQDPERTMQAEEVPMTEDPEDAA